MPIEPSILLERGITPDLIKDNPIDASEIFRKTESKVIKKALDSGESVFALKLPGFAGLVGREIQPDRRLGTELSDYARFWSGVGGIFHTDELPKYGIIESEVLKLRAMVSAEDKDAVVIVAETRENCQKALTAVISRAKEAVRGVPIETRVPLPNGTTKYARPRPGAKRMYPETDVRPIKITSSRLREIAQNMPETFDSKEKRFVNKLGLSEELASQIVRSVQLDLFEHLVKTTNVSPTLVAATLQSTLTSLHRDGVPTENLTDNHFQNLFEAVSRDEVSQEAISDILAYSAKHPKLTIEETLSKTGLGKVDTSDIKNLIRQIVRERIDFVKEHGLKSLGGLMGIAMKEFRGKADGKQVKELLAKEIERVLKE